MSHTRNMQLLLIQAMFMTDTGTNVTEQPVRKYHKSKKRPLRQFKRPRGNPAHSNRHLYTMKDMRG